MPRSHGEAVERRSTLCASSSACSGGSVPQAERERLALERVNRLAEQRLRLLLAWSRRPLLSDVERLQRHRELATRERGLAESWLELRYLRTGQSVPTPERFKQLALKVWRGDE